MTKSEKSDSGKVQNLKNMNHKLVSKEKHHIIIKIVKNKKFWLFLISGYILYIIFPSIQLYPHETGLDSSWMYALNYLPYSDYKFGQDVVFTMGPLGFLLHPLDIGLNILKANIFWIVVYILFIITTFYFMYKQQKINITFLFVATFLVSWSIMSATFAGLYFANQHILLLLVGLLLCLAITDQTNIKFIAATIAVVFSGLSLFIKLNLGLANIVMLILFLLIIIIQKHKNYRELLLTTIIGYIFTILFLAIILLASFGNLYRWLRSSFEIVSGYSAAMSYGTTQPLLLLLALLLVCLIFGLIIVFYRNKSTLFYTSIIFIVPIIFNLKEGFVRQDAGHMMFYFTFVPFVLTLFILLSSYYLNTKVITCLLCLSLFLVLVFPYATRPQNIVTNNLSRVGSTLIGIKAFSNIKLWTNLDDVFVGTLKQSQLNLGKNKLPSDWLSIIGNHSVDVLPWEISYIPANQLNWKPNPILQTYSAYTSYLDKLSASHVTGDSKSPDYLIIEYVNIDNRHPLLDAPLTWRNILLNWQLIKYDEYSGKYLLEKKNDVTLDGFYNNTSSLTNLGEWIQVPQSKNLLCAKISLQSQWFNRIVSTIYLLPPINLEISYENGEIISYRIIPDTLKNGILINFIPSNKEDMKNLLLGSAVNRVKSFRIIGSGLSYYKGNTRIDWIDTGVPIQYNYNN